jgi:very-short-patch-repair endonuclease
VGRETTIPPWPAHRLFPPELTSRAFTVEEARSHGLTEDHLRGRGWRRLGRLVYSRSEIASNPITVLQAALHRLPFDAVFCGRTAAFLHGLVAAPLIAIEAAVPPYAKTSHLVGITIRRREVPDDEVDICEGLPITSALRTAVDYGCNFDVVEAVSLIDAALHQGLVTKERLERWSYVHRGYRGVARLRRAIELSEPATESPMETRLRLLIVLGGLPRPEVQVTLPFGRADLYYPDHRLVIEYDGGTHRDSLVADNRRQNRLINAGYRILRFTAPDVFGAGVSVLTAIRAAFAETTPAPASGRARSSPSLQEREGLK